MITDAEYHRLGVHSPFQQALIQYQRYIPINHTETKKCFIACCSVRVVIGVEKTIYNTAEDLKDIRYVFESLNNNFQYHPAQLYLPPLTISS